MAITWWEVVGQGNSFGVHQGNSFGKRHIYEIAVVHLVNFPSVE